MIRWQCTSCGKSLAVKDEFAGKMTACPGCNNKMRAPASGSAPVLGPSAFTAGPHIAPPLSGPPREAIREPRPMPRPPAPVVDDWDEDEEYERRPRPGRRRKRRRRGSRGGSGISAYLIVLLAVPALCIPLTALVFLGEHFMLVPLAICAIVSIGTGFWLLGIAFQDSVGQGLACMFIPFYGLVYILTHFDDTKKPFCLNLVSGVTLLLCGLGGAAITSTLKQSQNPTPGPTAANPFPKPGNPNVQPPPPKPKPPADPGSPAPGLRAHWPFDEGKGDMAHDVGPHKLSAKLRGGEWVPGQRGMALQLNGTTDYVELDSSKELSFADNAPFTIALWVKTAKPKGMILSLRPKVDSPYDMFNIVLKDGKPIVQIRHQGNPFYPSEAKGTLAIHDGQWHHLAVTRTADGLVSLYLDGTFNAKTPPGFHGLQSKKLVTDNRMLGAEALVITGYSHPMLDRERLEGCLDELYFFGDALPETEIRKLANRR